jgi:hypothetical protein
MTTHAESKPAAQVDALRSAAAVRERCAMVHRFVAEGHSSHFTLDEGMLEDVADYTAQVTREAYPDLDIPYHSRWRHFSAGGLNRWHDLAQGLRMHPMERARMAIDLVTVSVLLDAGAGDAWRYREPATGLSYTRSEGLAVASLDMFRAGAFSSAPDRRSRKSTQRCWRAIFRSMAQIPCSDWRDAARSCVGWAARSPSGGTCSDARRRGLET